MIFLRRLFPSFGRSCVFLTKNQAATRNDIIKITSLAPQNSTLCHYSSNSGDPELEDFLAQLRKDFKTDEEPSEANVEKDSTSQENTDTLHELADSWSKISSNRYKDFDFSDTRVIYDVHEEELGFVEVQEEQEQKPVEPGINITRGVTGVLDLHQIVSILKKERAVDLVAFKLPREPQYVDHMVIASALSQRHLDAMAIAVKKHYVKAKKKKDKPLILEGKKTKWVAMDLGNTAIHLMSPSTRERLDIESLWCCGADHDPKTQQIEGEDQYSSFDFELFDPNRNLVEENEISSESLELHSAADVEIGSESLELDTSLDVESGDQAIEGNFSRTQEVYDNFKLSHEDK